MASKTAARQRHQQQQPQKDAVNGVIVSFNSDDSDEEEEGRSSSASSAVLSSADEPSSDDEAPTKAVKQPTAAPVSVKQELKKQPVKPESDEDSSEEEDGDAKPATGNGKANGSEPALTYSLKLQPSVVRADDKDNVDSESDVDEEIVNVFAKKQVTQKEHDISAPLTRPQHDISAPLTRPQLETADAGKDEKLYQKSSTISGKAKDALPDVALTEQQSKSSNIPKAPPVAEDTVTNGETTKTLPAPDIAPCNGKLEIDITEKKLENGHDQSEVVKEQSKNLLLEQTEKPAASENLINFDEQPVDDKKITAVPSENLKSSADKLSPEASEKQDGESDGKKVAKRTKKSKREKSSTKSDDSQSELTEKPDLLLSDVKSTLNPETNTNVTTKITEQTSNSSLSTECLAQADATGSLTNKHTDSAAMSVENNSDESPLVDKMSSGNAEQPADLGTLASAGIEKNENETRIIKPNLTLDEPSTEAAGDGEQIESTTGLVNEDSDYTFRRRSIDDFIRKILEEARLEQKKRSDVIQVAPEIPPVSPSSSRLLETENNETTAPLPQKADLEADILLPADVSGAPADVVTTPADVNVAQPLPDVTSMLDRRLASTERKREEIEKQLKTDGDGQDSIESRLASILSTDDSSLTNVSKFSTVEVTKCRDNETAGSNFRRTATATPAAVAAKVDEDIDQELADIGRYFAKRTPLNIDDVAVADQEDDLATGWLKVRPRAKPINFDDLENDIASVDGQDTDQPPSLTGRRFSIEEYVPQRRAETDEVIRHKIRPVRALIDQQTDIIQRLKVVGRDITSLDEEIRQLRQRCIIDRQSLFNSLGSAVAEETRLYELEQKAAEERLAKQVPFTRFVREQFVAANMSTNDYRLLRGRPPIPPLSSVGSGGGGSYYASASVGSDYRRGQSLAPTNDGDAYGWNRRDSRAGSVSREPSLPRFVVEDSTSTARRPSASVNLTSNYSRRPPTVSDDDIEDVIRRSRQARANSVGPGAFYSSSSADAGENRAFNASRSSAVYSSSDDYSEKRRSRVSMTSSEEDTATPRSFRRYSVAVDDTSGGASRFARRGSIGDYGGSSSRGTSGGEFQSKFLDKVRQRRALGMDVSSSQSSSAEKPFQSRFLRGSSSERRLSTAT